MWSSKKGFTLVELLVAIALLAILSTILLLAINPAQKLARARDSKRKADIGQITTALVSYETIYAQFPAETTCDSSIGSAASACPISPPQSGWSATSGLYLELIGKGFLKNLPVDPKNDSTYHYRYEPADTTEAPCTPTTGVCRYWIGVVLEAPDSSSLPVFRCSDDETLAAGRGCKAVAGFYQ